MIKELEEPLTGDGGATRVAWTDAWLKAAVVYHQAGWASR
jgi:hypothetical protein